MAERELTNYDKYLLKKREEQMKMSAGPDPDFDSGYAKYIISELRRKTPSENKVMTQEEYLQSSTKNSTASAKASHAKINSNKKKMGLAFLILYVIIVLALALIVMVNAKGKSVIPGADASAVEEGAIQPMPLEDGENFSENWFDEICDSLNK